MSLPKQVQRQLEDAEAIERNMATPGSDRLTSESGSESAEPVAKPKPADSPEKWEERYRRLQGKYDAEVPRLHQQLKEVSIELHTLRQQLSEAQQAQQQQQEQQPQRLVTDDEIEEHGKEYVDLYRRIAREEFQKDLSALQQENATLRQQLEQTGSQIGTLSFDQRLLQMVPDFHAINDSPDWIEWLDTVDPVLRGPRRMLAQAAFARGDADAVAHYVNLFKQSKSDAAPAARNKQSEIARQVQPDRSAPATAPASKQGKVYSSGDVDKLFRRVATLSSRGKLEEARKLELEIDAAFRDGRVSA
jgi:hypothetical protein